MLDAGLLVPTAATGLYQRSGDFEDAVRAVEAWAGSLRLDAYPRRSLPPILPRADFLQTDYLRSFPDLAGIVSVFTGGDAEHRALLEDLDAGGNGSTVLEPAETVLSSAVCHSVYPTLDPAIPDEGLRLEASGFAFRHEPSLDPVRMQSFRMLEHVCVGTPAQAEAHRDVWLPRMAEGLGSLGLDVRIEAANDPFFGRVGRMLAANQQQASLKHELVVDIHDEKPTAIGSTNYHEDHFSVLFDLTTPDGNLAHSGCAAFGLERIALALLSRHGLEPGHWPTEVRRELG
ncbi:hypothetical protein ISG29_01320 [Nocardioides sp. CBS4Y-1]|uniref:Aminoacyl-transfer RNA synthetases class-II family profile domain-containing protein n=1 Tax=Nocardioides acrostichi TaxID=2784339 RepID=A0A930Y4L3_9ACTN|nr:hypothetical protein [Nocardioides acrostichi]